MCKQQVNENRLNEILQCQIQIWTMLVHGDIFISFVPCQSLFTTPFPLTTPEVARGKKGGLGNNLFRYLRKRKRVSPISDGIRNGTLHTLDETKIITEKRC